MFTKTIKYTDYNGEEREETFYFNLTKTELQKLQNSVDGGFKSLIEKIVEEKSLPKLSQYFDTIIMMSYGEKSADGRRFIKQDGELAKQFKETPAYDILYTEILSSADTAAAFVRGILPADLSKAAE